MEKNNNVEMKGYNLKGQNLNNKLELLGGNKIKILIINIRILR